MLNKILHIVLLCFLLCKLGSSSLFWRIEKSPPSYIFGTVHIPYKLVWPYIAQEVQQAFNSSTHYYSEVDVKTEAYWDDFLQCLVNRSERVARSAESSNRGELLDIYLAEEGRRLNKTVGSLETAEFYCEHKGSQYNLTTWMIILDHIKQIIRNGTFGVREITSIEDIAKDYICDEIDDEYVEELWNATEEYDYINKRDKNIAQRIHKLLKKSKKHRYFFAIGSAHMFGQRQHIIERLKKYGYKITRLCTYQKRILTKFGCKKKILAKGCVKNKSKIKKKP